MFRYLLLNALFLLISSFLYAKDTPENICKSCLPKNIGDIVHRNSKATSLYSGHAGIVADYHHWNKTEKNKSVIFHVIPGYDKVGGALKRSTFEYQPEKRPWLAFMDFFSVSEFFWGTKQVKSGGFGNWPKPEAIKLIDHIDSFDWVLMEYDANHVNQKGKLLANGRWEYDCVGFVEHVMESYGYNITPDEYESGLGWPLTVREQRDSILLFNGPERP